MTVSNQRKLRISDNFNFDIKSDEMTIFDDPIISDLSKLRISDNVFFHQSSTLKGLLFLISGPRLFEM